MYKLSNEDRKELLLRLKNEKSSKDSDLIKAILWYDDGMKIKDIAKLLYVDQSGINRLIHRYFKLKIIRTSPPGRSPLLTKEQQKELISHLEENCYVKAKDIQFYIKVKYDVDMTAAAVTHWLNANRFSYKKPKLQPKADPELQKQFLKTYEDLEKTAAKNDEPVFFVDGVHPSQQTRPAYGWIRTGVDKVIPVTAARKRMNILGGIELENMTVIYEEFETINSQSAISFFKKLEAAYPDKKGIHVVLDNAGYFASLEVQEYTKTSRIKLYFLPPRSPNLNSSERLWKIMHEYVSNNKVYSKFSDFREAVRYFFNETIPSIKDVLISRVTDSFHV